jgi:hypothetical protein
VVSPTAKLRIPGQPGILAEVPDESRVWRNGVKKKRLSEEKCGRNGVCVPWIPYDIGVYFEVLWRAPGEALRLCGCGTAAALLSAIRYSLLVSLPGQGRRCRQPAIRTRGPGPGRSNNPAPPRPVGEGRLADWPSQISAHAGRSARGDAGCAVRSTAGCWQHAAAAAAAAGSRQQAAAAGTRHY